MTTAGGSLGGATTGVGCPWLVSCVKKPDADDDEQRSQKQIGRDEEDDAGVADTAHVNDGKEQENDQADLEGMRLQPGDGRDERTHAGGDADGRGEDVVDHERGCGEQAGVIAEVFASDGEGTAAVGIGFDGLGVGEIEDDEQDRGWRR